jgi:hypothetical protein
MKLDIAIAPSALVLTLVLTRPEASSCVAENDATPGGGGTWQVAAHFSPSHWRPSVTWQWCCCHHVCTAAGAQPHETPGLMQQCADAPAQVQFHAAQGSGSAASAVASLAAVQASVA